MQSGNGTFDVRNVCGRRRARARAATPPQAHTSAETNNAVMGARRPLGTHEVRALSISAWVRCLASSTLAEAEPLASPAKRWLPGLIWSAHVSLEAAARVRTRVGGRKRACSCVPLPCPATCGVGRLGGGLVRAVARLLRRLGSLVLGLGQAKWGAEQTT